MRRLSRCLTAAVDIVLIVACLEALQLFARIGQGGGI